MSRNAFLLGGLAGSVLVLLIVFSMGHDSISADTVRAPRAPGGKEAHAGAGEGDHGVHVEEPVKTVKEDTHSPLAAAHGGAHGDHGRQLDGLGLGRSKRETFAPRSDKLYDRIQVKPQEMPIRITIEGANQGDRSIDRTLPEGAKAVPPPKLSAEERLEKFRHMDLVYTWVNGSEMNQLFKKYKTFTRMNHRKYRNPQQRHQQDPELKKNAAPAPSIEEFLLSQTHKIVNGRDRESGELMFSLRSVQQFMKWHQGRIIIVSPGHVPFWVNHEAAWASRSLNRTKQLWDDDSTEFHRWFHKEVGKLSDPEVTTSSSALLNRIMIVHQDSLIPWQHRNTFNTNTIEPNIHRLKGLTEIFVQFNDDYLVGRETGVDTFVNEYGGPIVLFEKNVIRGGRMTYLRFRAQKSAKTWVAGVFHTNGLITDLLDSTIHGSVLDVLGRYFDKNRRPSIHPKRLFVKHAPFVYCRQMHKYIYKALSHQIDEAGQINKFRNYSDVVEPFIHHNVILDAPWRGSEQYINHEVSSDTVIRMDGVNACPPATAKIGEDAESRLMIMTDDLKENSNKFNEILREKPTFFALNDGFTNPAVGEMMRKFLSSTFPTPFRYDSVAPQVPSVSEVYKSILKPWPTGVAASKPTLHQQPLVLTVSHADFICASLRSLQLGFPTFDGPVHFIVKPDPELEDMSLQTMDVPGGSKTGMENNTPIPDWIVPCHLKTDKVFTHPLKAGFTASPAGIYHKVYGAHYETEKDKEDTSLPVGSRMLKFLTTDVVNPVFGQTVAMEDFEIKTVHKDDEGKHDTFLMASIPNGAINMIDGPTGSIRLRTFPLPYHRYETTPWRK